MAGGDHVERISTTRRSVAALIDGGVLIVLWQLTMALTGVRFPFGIMQNFARKDYDAYVYVMSWLALGVFVLSIVTHRWFAGSIGKLTVGSKTVQADGAPMTWRQIILRSAALGLIGLMILAPGPLIAFVFGKGSEAYSFAALWLGGLLLVITTCGLGQRSSMLERALGLETVRR